METSQLYTATEISQSTGLSRWIVLRMLAEVPPDGEATIKGQKAQAWFMASLPPALREAFARGPQKVWESPVPIRELHPKVVTATEKLREAFAPTFIHRFHDEHVTTQAMTELGLVDYARVFGHTIHPRTWQRYLWRIVARDSGAGNWQRLDIYLPEEAGMIRKPVAVVETPADPLADVLEAEVSIWADRLNPTAVEKKNLFAAAFKWLEAAKSTELEADCKRRLIAWIHQHTALSTEDTLRRVLNGKLKDWRAGGDAALKDKRATANAKRRTPALSEADEKLLVNHAVEKCDGAIAPAWRACYHQLSPDLRSRFGVFGDGARRKDYVPAFIVQAIRPKVVEVWKHHKGKHYARLHGAFIPRDWSGAHTGDVISTDDATLEVYGAVTLPDGSFKCIRGQFFPWVDEKSKYVFSFTLLAKENFHAHDILAGFYNALEQIGVPHVGIRTENGIFHDAKALGYGEQVNPWSDVRERFTDKLGIQWSFTKPRNPRGKIVENILRLIIRRLPGQKMFVGRAEQFTAREDVKRAIADVNEGRKHPHEVGMMLFDDWAAELEKIVSDYNNEPQQDAVVYDGLTLSPIQAFDKFLKYNAAGEVVPFAPFPRELRLQMSVPQRTKVDRNGIRKFIPGTKQPIYFRSAELGKRINESVLVHMDPARMDEVFVTDLKGENGLLVPRVKAIPAIGATPEQLREAHAEVAAFSEYGQTYYRQLPLSQKHRFGSLMMDAASRNKLQSITTQRGQHEAVNRVEVHRQRTETARSNRNLETLNQYLNED